MEIKSIVLNFSHDADDIHELDAIRRHNSLCLAIKATLSDEKRKKKNENLFCRLSV
jgi:hypothetical protein